MKHRILSCILCILLVLGAACVPVLGAQNSEDVVLLYENDVHCAVEGYSKLAAMKRALSADFAHVGVLSCGDYIQGGSLGVISQGEYIVELMNLVGYDALTLGNHEFDYGLPRLEELIARMDTAPVCCNLTRRGETDSLFAPYSIVSYGDVDIAYVGVTTPEALTKTSLAQFKDEAGNYLYTLHPTALAERTQQAVDAARAEGADYVIALSHIGEADIAALVGGTRGLDVVLDAHSHSVIESRRIPDADGREVLLSSTGTKFEYIGRLTLSGGVFTSELIRTEDYPATDPAVDARLAEIDAEYSVLGERRVAESKVDLITQSEDGVRLSRIAETNLGDLCADAFRSGVDADIGYINGGGLRAEVSAGEVTFNDLLSVLPFNNTLVKASLSGQAIKDLLEMAMMHWPEEGSFPHVSGITFSFNTQIASSVVLDETETFVGVAGPYRVYNIKVQNRESGAWEPLSLTERYTVASHNYYLIEHGSGMSMLEDAVILQNDGTLDVEALERYVVEELGGVIGEQYRDVSQSITFTAGEVSEAAPLPTPLLLVTAVSGGLLLCAALAGLFYTRRARARKD